jgi:hypothetical protein
MVPALTSIPSGAWFCDTCFRQQPSAEFDQEEPDQPQPAPLLRLPEEIPDETALTTLGGGATTTLTTLGGGATTTLTTLGGGATTTLNTLEGGETTALNTLGGETTTALNTLGGKAASASNTLGGEGHHYQLPDLDLPEPGVEETYTTVTPPNPYKYFHPSYTHSPTTHQHEPPRRSVGRPRTKPYGPPNRPGRPRKSLSPPNSPPPTKRHKAPSPTKPRKLHTTIPGAPILTTNPNHRPKTRTGKRQNVRFSVLQEPEQPDTDSEQ